jgi:SAM-dependent methyltransferase
MNATCEWWESFFHGPWGEWQREGYPEERTRTEADLIVSALGLDDGNAVLDVACGIGRHANELAARGIDVTGVDFNASALTVARRAAAARGLTPRFVERDMRCLRFREEFDAAYCFFTSFGYFEDESHDLVVAKRIAEALRPGGRFLIDVMITETILPIFQAHRWDWLDETRQGRLLQDSRWDFERSRVEGDWTFVEDGRIRSSHSSLRVYSYRELCDLLREAGFQKFEGFDTLTGQPFTFGARRLSLVASLA